MGLITLSGGCQCPGARRVYPPKINPNAPADAIAMFDKNGDGKLSGDELDKCPGLKAALNRLDPAKTGAVTADMIARASRRGVPRDSAGCRCGAPYRTTGNRSKAPR